MESYQIEREFNNLPYHPPRLYRQKEPDLLDLLEKGDAVIMRDLPHWENLQSFSRDLLSNHCIITVAAARGITLDHVLNFLTPPQKKYLTRPFKHRDSIAEGFEEPGDITIDSIKISVRPLGKSAKLGFRKISVRSGNKRGFLLDLSEIASDINDIESVLRIMKKNDIVCLKSGTASTICRDTLLANCMEGFPTLLPNDEKSAILWTQVYPYAISVFRLGRFESVFFGSKKGAYTYDYKAAYPTEIGRLQHCGYPYTEWQEWNGDYSQLDRPDICYAFLLIEENIPKTQASIASHKYVGMGGARLYNPWGVGIRFVGLQQYILRSLQGIKPKVLRGWMGFTKIPYRPFEALIRKMFAGRLEASKQDILGSHLGERKINLFKLLDTRINGNFMGSYWDIIDDGTLNGRSVRKPLSTYCPVYAAAVVDAVFSNTTRLILTVPEDMFYRAAVDSVTVGIPLTTQPDIPGGLNGGFVEDITSYTDHFMASPKHNYDFRGDHIVFIKNPKTSFYNCFTGSRLREKVLSLEDRQKLFDAGFRREVIEVPTGPTKRLPLGKDIDYSKEWLSTLCPNTLQLGSLIYESPGDSDILSSLDEGE